MPAANKYPIPIWIATASARQRFVWSQHDQHSPNHLQFSCGAASAVATMLALAEYGQTHDVQIVNAFLANEHADNCRFLEDCQDWFGRPITVLADEKYGADITQVFRRER